MDKAFFNLRSRIKSRRSIICGSVLSALLASSAVFAAETTPAPNKMLLNKQDGLNYVWIPSGTFMMGCSSGDQFCRPNEGPAHQVTITHGFWIGQTPVTQAAYQKVMGTNPSKFRGDQLPVDSVTWANAHAYCARVGMRLPTEAEWEYAERGGTATARYAPIAAIAWYKEDAGGTTHKVAQRVPNAYGLYDMMGDVLEWVSDWWSDQSYHATPVTDPTGAPSGQYHILRGGAWWSCPEDIRTSARFSGYDPPNQNVDGFRCAGPEIADSAPAEPLQRSVPEPYHISSKWKVDGENALSKVEVEAAWSKIKSDEKWGSLSVDPAAQRLYIVRDTKVEVVNTATGKLAATIRGFKSSLGIALDDAGHYGFVSDAAGHDVVVFDRHNLTKVASINVGPIAPGRILFEPTTDTVWSFDSKGNRAAVIDAATLRLIDTVTLPGQPTSAVAGDNGSIYDNIEDKDEIVRINARSRAITAQWHIDCTSPSGIAIDLVGHRLISVCRQQKAAVVDYETGKVLAYPQIGQEESAQADGVSGEADGAAFSSKDGLAYIATTDGFLSVINFKSPSYPTIEKLITYPGARTITYDPVDDRIYTVSADTQMITPPVKFGGHRAPGKQGGPGGNGGPGGPGGGAGGNGPGGPGGPIAAGGASQRTNLPHQLMAGGPQNASDPRGHGVSKRIVIPGTFVAFVIDRSSSAGG